jgi:hypothetical protein
LLHLHAGTLLPGFLLHPASLLLRFAAALPSLAADPEVHGPARATLPRTGHVCSRSTPDRNRLLRSSPNRNRLHAGRDCRCDQLTDHALEQVDATRPHTDGIAAPRDWISCADRISSLDDAPYRITRRAPHEASGACRPPCRACRASCRASSVPSCPSKSADVESSTHVDSVSSTFV